MNDVRYRLMGIVFLAGSAGTTLAHRRMFEVARHGPAQIGELALALLTFTLAIAGMLLVIHGSRLCRSGRRSADAGGAGDPHDRVDPASANVDDAALDGRGEVGSLLARRAVAAALGRAIGPGGDGRLR